MILEDKTLRFEESLNKNTVTALQNRISKFPDSRIDFIDLSGIENIDSAGVAFLDELILKNEIKKSGIINPNKQVSSAISTFSSLDLDIVNKPKSNHFFVRIGEAIYDFRDKFLEGLILTADISFWSFVGIFSNKGQRKGSIIQQSILIGVNALGIIGLLSLIIGLILALQSAAQLRQYGASIFVADLIAISMVREMGPMMTAIIVAGRSGSAIASEIATMKVTEEIDALKMMAINPVRYVVVPKFHAITICMPLLVTMSTIIGIIGGLIVAILYLDLSAISYFNEVFKVLTVKDLLVGLSKSIVFSWFIVAISSYYGFNVKGGSEGVGKATTMSVVASIFAVIILDAVFSILYLGK